MSKGINIDFTHASIISNKIDDKKSVANSIVSKYSFNTSGLPADYFKKTLSNINIMKEKVSKISKLIAELSYGFDNSIETYYQMEHDIQVEDGISPVVTGSDVSKKFVWGYKQNNSQIQKVDNSMLEKLMISKGAKRVETNVYEMNIDGVNYKYSTQNGKLYVNGVGFKCDFYVSNNYQNKPLNSTVTLLGGAGERQYGPIGNHQVSESIGLGSDSVLVVPYSGDPDKKLNPNCLVGSNEFVEHIFNTDNNITRSVVGFSEGSKVASEAISENPELYDNVVFVNGSTRYTSDFNRKFIKNGNYTGFKNTNVYYIITKGGWNVNSVTKSIDDLLVNGVDPSNITLISNDNRITNSVNNNINVANLIPTSTNEYEGHVNGAWNVINKSEIINYLSA